MHIAEYNEYYGNERLPRRKVYLPQKAEADAARFKLAFRFSTRTSPHTRTICEVLCPTPPFAEPTLNEWAAKEQELADSAAARSQKTYNSLSLSAFNHISAEAEAVEWVNPNLGAIKDPAVPLNQVERCGLEGINRGNYDLNFLRLSLEAVMETIISRLKGSSTNLVHRSQSHIHIKPVHDI